MSAGPFLRRSNQNVLPAAAAAQRARATPRHGANGESAAYTPRPPLASSLNVNGGQQPAAALSNALRAKWPHNFVECAPRIAALLITSLGRGLAADLLLAVACQSRPHQLKAAAYSLVCGVQSLLLSR